MSILTSILTSLLASYIFWLLSFRYSGTDVVFASQIEKSTVSSAPNAVSQYRLQIANIGNRDLIDIEFVAKLSINDDGGVTHVAFCQYGMGKLPCMNGSHHDCQNTYIDFLRVNDYTLYEFQNCNYSKNIQQKARNGILSFDDLFTEFGSKLSLQIWAYGSDSISLTRRVFISPTYKSENFVTGQYVSPRSGEELPINLFHCDRLRAKAQELLSRIVEDVSKSCETGLK